MATIEIKKMTMPKIVVRHVSKKGKLYKRVKTKQISTK